MSHWLDLISSSQRHQRQEESGEGGGGGSRQDQSVVITSSPVPHTSQFLASPAYPKYYKGGRQCRWSLRTEPGQRIQVNLPDYPKHYA